MKSPSEQKIIQIDLTNVCTHSCSNCTRFCGHHEKPFMMDFETFKRAVDSLVDSPGIVGIMGGEPTLHPEFGRFVEYYASKIGAQEPRRRALEPIVDFSEYRTRELADVCGRRGLFTSLGKGYYRHFELIQEVFDYQCINDHTNPGLHQALLVSRRELGVTDEEWVPLRDNCWIQNLWSSTVTPKGAFFCEVAGALDMLFGGPGGLEVDSEWWKRTPDQFGDQLQWCELCGAALQVPRRLANEEVDDISPVLCEKLKAVNSPKLRRQRVEVLDVGEYSAEEYACDPSMEWYLPDGDNQQRIDGTNRTLYPQEIVGVLVSSEPGTDVPPELARHFDRAVVVEPGVGVGELEALGISDWVVLLGPDTQLDEEFGRKVRSWILNPGCFYFQPRFVEAGLAAGAEPGDNGLGDDLLFAMFNMRARALRDRSDDAVRMDRWEQHKRIDFNAWFLSLSKPSRCEVEGEMMARHLASLWSTANEGRRNVWLYGCGQHTLWLLSLLRRFDLPRPTGIFDDSATPGQDIDGIPVLKPDEVAPPDAVVLSPNTRRVADILKRRCSEVWHDAVAVIDPYACFQDKKYRKTVPE